MALIEKKLAGEEISVAPEPEERAARARPDGRAAGVARQAKDDKRKGGAKPAGRQEEEGAGEEDEVARAREGEGLAARRAAP